MEVGDVCMCVKRRRRREEGRRREGDVGEESR